jgi:hypothetical protein
MFGVLRGRMLPVRELKLPSDYLLPGDVRWLGDACQMWIELARDGQLTSTSFRPEPVSTLRGVSGRRCRGFINLH